MFQELIEYFGGHGADVGATQACLNEMNGIANRSDQHLSLEFIVVEDRHDIADQVHSILADIIQAADKGADEIRAGLCGHDFFFSSRRRHTIWPRDWSSDVCSSD